MDKTEMEHPALEQTIWVLPEAVPIHMASGWAPVDAAVSEERAEQRAQQRVDEAEEQAARSAQIAADAQDEARAEQVPEQPPAPEQPSEQPPEPSRFTKSRKTSGPAPAPQGPDQPAGTENQE